MTCNYFEYRDITEKLFYGVPLTDKHLNDATEQIRRYLIDGGAGNIVKALGIGIRVVTKETLLLQPEVISKRFVYIDGENKGRDLDRNEIESIGMFLKYGALYGKCGCPACQED